jgi:hypothetical protein
MRLTQAHRPDVRYPQNYPLRHADAWAALPGRTSSEQNLFTRDVTD